MSPHSGIDKSAQSFYKIQCDGQLGGRGNITITCITHCCRNLGQCKSDTYSLPIPVVVVAPKPGSPPVVFPIEDPFSKRSRKSASLHFLEFPEFGDLVLSISRPNDSSPTSSEASRRGATLPALWLGSGGIYQISRTATNEPSSMHSNIWLDTSLPQCLGLPVIGGLLLLLLIRR